MTAAVSIKLTGGQYALLDSAAFMYCEWPFLERATRIRSDADISRSRELSDVLHAKCEAVFQKHGLGIGTESTRELICRRKKVSEEIVLTAEQLADAIRAVDFCVAEFRTASGWIDLCVASPGDLQAYGLEHADLLELSSYLKSLAG